MHRFTNIYPLSKTLRFELKPIGKTLDNIISCGIIEQDKHRDSSYQRIKKIIDEYHKVFIESVLEHVILSQKDEGKKNSLEEFLVCYMSKLKDDKQKKNFEQIQKNLRKQIVNNFSSDDRFKRIDKEDLIKSDLVAFVNNIENKRLIKSFNNFTTYFTGFHQNRKNMYSAEAQSTSIAYRLIHENLPRFIDNMSVFEKIKATSVSGDLLTLYDNFTEYLSVNKIDDMFKLNYYNNVLTQKQIDIYNAVIGGKTIGDSNVKIKGINEYVNLYNQEQPDRSKCLPKLKPLYKQILSDRNVISWLPEQFESDEQVLETIQKSYLELKNHVLNTNNEGNLSLKELLQSLSNYDLNKIYIRNDQQLTDISQKVFGHWSVISNAMSEELKRTMPKKSKKETDEAYTKRLDKIIESQGSISIAQINQSVQAFNNEISYKLQSYFSKLGAINTDSLKKENLFLQIENAYINMKDLLNTPYPTNKNLAQDKQNIEMIKNLLDAIKALQHFVKPLLGDGTESDKDERFYGEFCALYKEIDKITPLYDMVRNYITRRPYSTDKIKLNFENPTLMKGWDLNKERNNTTVILRKEGLYYLAIMDKRHNKVMDIDNLPADGECLEKMEYKFFKDLTTMVPKCTTQLKVVKKHFETKSTPYYVTSSVFASPFEITKEEYELNNVLVSGKKKFQIDYLKITGDEIGYKKALAKWIKFCLRFISQYKSTMVYDIPFHKYEAKINSYPSLDVFYSEINLELYKLDFRNVSVSYINQLVEEGKLYLFQIYNKDFSPYSKGTPNLHTLYWKMLFDNRNLADVVYKLNGEAEVFFRKSSIEYKHPTHPANQPISNKNILNNKKYSKFSYDLIKDKRYTIDKFQFHVPITINFKSTESYNINQSVKEYIRHSKDLHIIGIDRGERHLLYLTVIDLKGNIKEQFSLNDIVNEYKGKTYNTNYHDLLVKREKEKLESRRNWQTIENIKNLKEGYLSQVIHKISELMIRHNAIVVLEALNPGFMRGRQKVESSVYQKFEKMLIDKLNYLVDKNKQPQEAGGILKAYQLTNKFTSFQQLGSQSGFLFYVPAWNTSKMDPITGFVNLLDTRYETREKARAFLKSLMLFAIIISRDGLSLLLTIVSLQPKQMVHVHIGHYVPLVNVLKPSVIKRRIQIGVIEILTSRMNLSNYLINIVLIFKTI